jgi:hypothetical protein
MAFKNNETNKLLFSSGYNRATGTINAEFTKLLRAFDFGLKQPISLPCYIGLINSGSLEILAHRWLSSTVFALLVLLESIKIEEIWWSSAPFLRSSIRLLQQTESINVMLESFYNVRFQKDSRLLYDPLLGFIN